MLSLADYCIPVACFGGAKLHHIFVLLFAGQPLRAYYLRLVGEVEGKEK